ncbi:hypothetical protein CCACVL1_06950 [Corchorus capsularis]|uniref:Glabrous enhancer-binding protein-like DBD domain-containing protein n=1 Tax=Corchorus capsularis TaxID=210143 RepID=A0A1R3JAV0_COCAP|nr:hypothetical protein CCACVL1_06950 [Corchorus capsularis]
MAAKAIKTPPPPPKDHESSSSNGEEDEEESKTGTQNTPPVVGVVGEEDKSGGGESDSESDAGMAAKKSQGTMMISNSKAAQTPSAAAGKRGRESDLAVKKSKAKRAKGEEGEETALNKKTLFQRVFSESDEIDLLRGIKDYYDHESNGNKEMNDAFYEFIMGSIKVSVNKGQVVDKVRRLRKKYNNLAGKSNNGKDPSFSKDHDKKLYKLSKRIWGAKAKDNDEEDMAMEDPKEKELILSSDVVTGTATAMADFNRTEERVLKDCMARLTAEKRDKVEKKLKVIQLESYLKRSGVICKLVESTLRAYKSK